MTQTDQIIVYYVTGDTDGQESVESESLETQESKRQEVFQCQFCPSTFDRELGLYGHLNSHKVCGVDSSHSVTQRNSPGWDFCLYCYWMLIFIPKLESFPKTRGRTQVQNIARSKSDIDILEEWATRLNVLNAAWDLTARANLATTSRRIMNRYHLRTDYFNILILKVVRHSCPICNKGFYRSSDCKVAHFPLFLISWKNWWSDCPFKGAYQFAFRN